jgi:hypothetical protein
MTLDHWLLAAMARGTNWMVPAQKNSPQNGIEEKTQAQANGTSMHVERQVNLREMTLDHWLLAAMARGNNWMAPAQKNSPQNGIEEKTQAQANGTSMHVERQVNLREMTLDHWLLAAMARGTNWMVPAQKNSPQNGIEEKTQAQTISAKGTSMSVDY